MNPSHEGVELTVYQRITQPTVQRRHETQGVYHGPEVEPQGQKWYGSDPEPLERWLGYVLPDPAQWPATPSAPASVTSAAPAATEGR